MIGSLLLPNYFLAGLFYHLESQVMSQETMFVVVVLSVS